jgi:hypothetical protein
LFNIFKKDSASLINGIQSKAFAAWRIKDNDIARRIRFRAGVGFYCAAVLLDDAGEEDNGLPSLVYSKIKESVENDRCKISAVFSISKNVRCVSLSEEIFRQKTQLFKSGRSMDGRAFVTEIWDCFSIDVIKFIVDRKYGAFGIDYAGVLAVKDLTLGKIEGDFVKDMSLAKEFPIFAAKIVQTLRL